MRPDYMPWDRLAEIPSADKLLASIRFGDRNQLDPDSPGCLTVGLPQLVGTPVVETWSVPEVAEKGWDRGIGYTRGTDVLFGSLLVEESAFPDLADATYHAYLQLQSFLERHGYPAILRIWNFIEDIHGESGGIERYQAFCVGRARAFDKNGLAFGALPAASAIGSNANGLLIYFLAAVTPGQQLENPRQTSAFLYPMRYGPRPPYFSRALLKDWGNMKQLFVSGTASVLGHLTAHEGSAIEQLEETLQNLDILSRMSGLQEGSAVPALQLLKAYVRNSADADMVANRLADWMTPDIRLAVLKGDICRPNLMLEIEGITSY